MATVVHHLLSLSCLIFPESYAHPWDGQEILVRRVLTASPGPSVSSATLPAKLAREKALVDAVVTRAQAQAKETGEAQQSTVARDEAVKALDKWVGELRTVLKVALRDDPEALESVGITIMAAGRKKKAAPAPAGAK